jgi:hypothetical protein
MNVMTRRATDRFVCPHYSPIPFAHRPSPNEMRD